MYLRVFDLSKKHGYIIREQSRKQVLTSIEGTTTAPTSQPHRQGEGVEGDISPLLRTTEAKT